MAVDRAGPVIGSFVLCRALTVAATLMGPRVWPMAKPSAAFWTPADARVDAFVQRSRPTRLKLFAATATTAAGVFLVALLDSATMGDPFAFWKAQGLWTAPPRNPLFPAAVLARAAVHLDFTNSQALGLPCLIAFTAAAYWVAYHLPPRYLASVVALLAVSAARDRQF